MDRSVRRIRHITTVLVMVSLQVLYRLTIQGISTSTPSRHTTVARHRFVHSADQVRQQALVLQPTTPIVALHRRPTRIRGQQRTILTAVLQDMSTVRQLVHRATRQ